MCVYLLEPLESYFLNGGQEEPIREEEEMNKYAETETPHKGQGRL